MSEPKPICPYCGKALTQDVDEYHCWPCGMDVPARVAESRPFRVEWGLRAAEDVWVQSDEADTRRIAAMHPANVIVRRLVSEWEPDRG